MKTQSIFKHWSKNGFRVTPARKAIADIFFHASKPLPVSEITIALNAKGFTPNKTTIYREIVFMLEQGFVNEVNIAGRKKFYEIKKHHHHHLICRECKVTREVRFDEMELLMDKVQSDLRSNTSFYDIRHSLEFYGVCPNCIS